MVSRLKHKDNYAYYKLKTFAMPYLINYGLRLMELGSSISMLDDSLDFRKLNSSFRYKYQKHLKMWVIYEQ